MTFLSDSATGTFLRARRSFLRNAHKFFTRTRRGRVTSKRLFCLRRGRHQHQHAQLHFEFSRRISKAHFVSANGRSSYELGHGFAFEATGGVASSSFPFRQTGGNLLVDYVKQDGDTNPMGYRYATQLWSDISRNKNRLTTPGTVRHRPRISRHRSYDSTDPQILVKCICACEPPR